jgi:aryl-alcohol dehydrogenase-like predicted oxidoreductase
MCPTVSWRKPEHSKSALRAVELKLSPEILTRLNEIFPGPGLAPSAYGNY